MAEIILLLKVASVFIGAITVISMLCWYLLYRRTEDKVYLYRTFISAALLLSSACLAFQVWALPI